MSWITNFQKFEHRVHIAFIELKIEGSWVRETKFMGAGAIQFEVLKANSGNCVISVIEPDGLRRTLGFKEGSTMGINQNILSYNPEKVEEITVDENEQAGKGKTREIL